MRINELFSDFTPNKLVTFDNREPPWMTDFVKIKIKWKNQLYITYVKSAYKFNDHLHFQEATNLASEVIAKRKHNYHNNLALKLNNPATIAKTCWSILKTFYNGKKIPVIPPTFNKQQACFKL